MESTQHSSSLQSEYIKLSALMLAVSIIISVVIGVSFYYAAEKKGPLKAMQEASYIDQSLTATFEHASQIMQFAGSKIVQLPELDLRQIHEILSIKAFTAGMDVSFSWSLLDWIDNQHQMRVNSLHGVIDPPIDMSKYYNKRLDPQKTWTLQFFSPTYGIPSNEWVLPAVMDISNAEGKCLGSVTLGFNLSVLANRIASNSRYKELGFAVLDSQQHVIFASAGINVSELENKLLTRKISTEDRLSILEEPIELEKDYRFEYSKPMTDYPFFILIGENKAHERHAYYAAVLPRFFELVGMGIFGVMLLYVFRKKIVRPIALLSNAAKQIVLQNDVILPEFELVEMNVLAEQLMLIQRVKGELKDAKTTIENAHRSIHKHNILLEEKVKERTKELEKALSAKTDFLNNLSHEIRTPIHGITAISEGLIEHWDAINDAARKQYATNVAENAKRLLSLMSNLLDLSKFTAGKMMFQFAEVALEDIIRNIAEECRSLYLHNSDVKLAIELPSLSEHFAIEADADRLLQLLRNLLQNAIKFTQYGTVTLALSEGLLMREDSVAQAAWVITISDEGVGIPEDELEEIFIPFSQSSFTKTYAGGTGLGLSICREIVRGHAGTISAANRYDQHRRIIGAIFTVMLPMHQNIVRSEATTKDLIKRLQTEPEEKTKEETAGLAETLSSLHILVVDDEPTCITSLELILYTTGCHMTCAKTGEEALEALASDQHFDVMLLDLMLPDMTGLDILRQVRSSRRYGELKVILQTGAADPKELREAYELGIVMHILKPYQAATVMAALEKTIK